MSKDKQEPLSLGVRIAVTRERLYRLYDVKPETPAPK